MASYLLRKAIGINRNNIRCCCGLWTSNQYRQYFEGKFQDEANQKILKVLNDFNSAHDLNQYSISKINAKKLLKCKTENGPFTTLNDPLRDVGPLLLEKFYRSILSDGTTAKTLRSPSSVFLPMLSEAENSVRNVVSICFTGNVVSWSLVSKQKKSLDSEYDLELDKLTLKKVDFKPKNHFLTNLEMVRDVMKEIPPSDVYVIEEANKTVPTAYLFNYAIHMAQIRSFAIGLLASREHSRIMSVKPTKIARLFKLHVGYEKVSGQIIAEMTVKNEEGLNVSEEIRWNYLKANAEDREHLANVLLLNIAYWMSTNQYASRLELKNRKLGKPPDHRNY